jgi:hypothetical protein
VASWFAYPPEKAALLAPVRAILVVRLFAVTFSRQSSDGLIRQPEGIVALLQAPHWSRFSATGLRQLRGRLAVIFATEQKTRPRIFINFSITAKLKKYMINDSVLAPPTAIVRCVRDIRGPPLVLPAHRCAHAQKRQLQ